MPSARDDSRQSPVFDRASLRSRVVDANDGIIATAGIVEGFAGAGASGTTVLAAAFAAMVAGGISLGGAKYNEAAVEHDSELAVLEEERRQLELAPEEELAELAALYEAKGLSAELAGRVADELTARDALAAHAEAEHGLMLGAVPTPVLVALTSGVAFALGSGVPLLVVLLASTEQRIVITFIAVVVSLCVTSVVSARAGGISPARTVLRTTAIGIVTMILTLAGGSLVVL